MKRSLPAINIFWMRKTLGRSINLVRKENPPAPSGEIIFERRFPADNEVKNEVLSELLAALVEIRAIESGSELMRLCLDEALVNAVMHGSKYDVTKSVQVRAFRQSDKWSVLVEDEGPGFREEDLPDPDAPENLLEESGRGVHLMRSLMDEVSYWRGGSALLLSRRFADTVPQPAKRSRAKPKSTPTKARKKRKPD